MRNGHIHFSPTGSSGHLQARISLSKSGDQKPGSADCEENPASGTLRKLPIIVEGYSVPPKPYLKEDVAQGPL
jgi:hypothetical protein